MNSIIDMGGFILIFIVGMFVLKNLSVAQGRKIRNKARKFKLAVFLENSEFSA